MEWHLERGPFVRLEGEARSLLESMRANEAIDLAHLTRSTGVTVAYLLCGLFREDAATRAYWIDDVVIEEVQLSDRPTSVLAKGFAWCGDHRSQWQVPALLTFRFCDGGVRVLERLIVNVGDGSVGTL